MVIIVVVVVVVVVLLITQVSSSGLFVPPLPGYTPDNQQGTPGLVMKLLE